MKLSEATTDVLKNFATINSGIQIKKGNVIRTISKQQNVLGKATVAENFDSEFVIYDLNRFLSLITSLNDPDITVNDEKNVMTITSGSSRTTYGLSDATMIIAPPAKEIKVDSPEVDFKLTKDSYSQILKMTGILGLPNIGVIGDGKNIKLSTFDAKNSGSDDFSIDVGETKAKFKMIFSAENLKIIPGDYDVSITSKGISHFKNTKSPIEYWIAVEPGSSYEE
jgi:hypothetical protein